MKLFKKRLAVVSLSDESTHRALTAPGGASGKALATADYKTALAVAQPMLAARRVPIGLWAFIVLVIVPTLASIVYFGLIASPRYVSEALLTVRTSSSSSADQVGTPALASMALGTLSNGFIVQNFVSSRRILEQLRPRVNLRALWGKSSVDWFSRLSEEATEEELLRYFWQRVNANFDPTTGIIDLTVEAFEPLEAQLIATAVVAVSDDLVNSMSNRAREDAVAFARSELDRAVERSESARLAMQSFRNQYGNLDPNASATALDAVISEIRSDLAKAQTELSNLRSYMSPAASQVVAVQRRISALELQLKNETRRVSFLGGGASYSELLSRYERLKIENTYAESAYTAAMAFYETARAEAAARHVYLVPFAPPSIPDESTKPSFVRMVAITVIGSLVIFGILALIVAAIREHARL